MKDAVYCVETLNLPVNERIKDVRETPLMYAAQSGNVELARYLVAHGANPIMETYVGNASTANYALRSGNIEMLRYFVEELHIAPTGGYVAQIDIAAGLQNIELAEYLYDHGLIVCNSFLPRMTLDFALLREPCSFWKNRLKEFGKEALYTGKDDIEKPFKPITECAGDPKIIEFFLKHGIAAHSKHLFWAVMAHQPEIVRVLLEAKHLSLLGRPAQFEGWIDFAKEDGTPEIVAEFEKYREEVYLLEKYREDAGPYRSNPTSDEKVKISVEMFQ